MIGENLATSLATRTVKYTHNAIVALGEVLLLGTRVVMATAAYAADVEGLYIYHSEIVEGEMAAVTITSLEPAYWDDTAKKFTNVVSTNTLCGMFLEDRASTESKCVLALQNI